MAKNILLMLTCMLVSDWANVLLKLGVEQTGVGLSWEKILAMVSNPWLLSGVALYGGGMFLWLTVLEKNEFGFVMAFFSLHYVHLMLLAKYVFHEPIRWNMWLGTLMIVLGVGMFNITELLANES
jgi:drug/metabolite transporter (DMT)-like permease